MRNRQCLYEALIRRFVALLRPPWRVVALGIFWQLALEEYQSWLPYGDSRHSHLTYLRELATRVLVDGKDPGEDMPEQRAALERATPTPAISTLFHIFERRILDARHGLWRKGTMTATAVAHQIRSVLEWLVERPMSETRENTHPRWVCDLLAEWWRNVTTRVAVATAVKLRQWPPPRNPIGLLGQMARMEHNAGVPFDPGYEGYTWIGLLAHQETVRRAVAALNEMEATARARPGETWVENPTIDWARQHAGLVLGLNPRYPQEEILTEIREREEAVPYPPGPLPLDATVEMPEQVVSLLRAIYKYPFVRGGHTTSQLNFLLEGITPLGRVFPVLETPDWTRSPWKEIVADWWSSVWHRAVALDPRVALG